MLPGYKLMPISNSQKQAFISVAQFRQLLKQQHPFAQVLGMEILEISHGQAIARLPANPSNQRLGGIVAGPMLMGLADLALYAAVVSVTGVAEAVTASLSINFMRSAPAGALLARANIHKTGRLSAGDVIIYPEAGGETIAQAISTWSVPRKAS